AGGQARWCGASRRVQRESASGLDLSTVSVETESVKSCSKGTTSATAMRSAVLRRHIDRAVLPLVVSRPTIAGLIPIPRGSTALVAAASPGPERPAACMAALRGLPSSLRSTLLMGRPRADGELLRL